MSMETMESTINTPTAENDDLCTCSICGSMFAAEDGIYFDDHDLCLDCIDDQTEICSCCGERIWSNANAGDTDTVLCQRCYDRHYTNCEECGAVISYDDSYHIDDDDYEYCYTCYSRKQSEQRYIHDYSYRPDPIFYPKHDNSLLYLGVELEIDNGGESAANAEVLLDIANQEHEFMYIKHDGSLNRGMELVTHPLTLDYHCNHMPWKEVCARAVQLGYTSHMANTCGLHVHLSREALGENMEKQEETIARLLYFMEAHFNEMLRFSRRTQSQLNRWAARYGYKEQPKDILDHAKNCNLGRYTAVNLQNYDTVEIRIFRGTLKYNTLIAALQMVHEICRTAIFLSDEEFRAMSWQSFVLGISPESCPELIEYLKIRRLYVNEPIEAEEEI